MIAKRMVHWAARLLAIAAIVFISTFALDVFEPGKPWCEIAAGLVMHLFPSLLLIIILVVAWHVEWLGGGMFIIVGLAPIFMLSNPLWINLVLGAPFLLAGLLFLASHRLSKNRNTGVHPQ